MVRHTFDPHMVNSPRAHLPLIRTRLTKELTNGVAAMHNETIRCLGEVLPKDTNRTKSCHLYVVDADSVDRMDTCYPYSGAADEDHFSSEQQGLRWATSV